MLRKFDMDDRAQIAKSKRMRWLKDARQARPNEKIGAGWFVFSRQLSTGRIHPAPYPFEHPDRASAEAEAGKLASRFPGREFVIMQQVGGVMVQEVSDG